MRRPFAPVDWNGLCCGWRGHVTYRPEDRALADRLCTQTAVGEAWRCLRCAAFVAGPPDGGGPTAGAPGVFIPFEVYELARGITAMRVAAFAVNVFAVAYLLWTKRLFGLRGGDAALVAARRSASLLEQESAALARATE